VRARIIGTVVVLMWAMVGVFATVDALPAAAATNLDIGAGTSTADPAVQGLNFYPGLVTIATGDSVTWHFAAPHTVNLYTDPGPPEAPGVGDGTFTGTSDPESSGVVFPAPGHDTYKLTFSNAGNYVYFCALHPGMTGVVQVGSGTPTTQSQADAAAATESAGDLASATAARDAFTPTSQGAVGGGTQKNDADGIGSAQATTTAINAVSPSTASGSGSLAFNGTTLHVVLTMTGMSPSTTSHAHIHSGQCAVSSPPKGAANDILFPLTDVAVDANGNGTSTTDITWDPSTLGPPVLATHSWYINVHDPNTPATVLACGNVAPHPGSVHHFLPTITTISAGDTVKWTQMDAREVHPIYFGPADKEPADPFAPPSGGNTVSSPNTPIQAGPLFGGDTFNLKFTQPGVYNYICTLHDVEGMTGQVVVLPTGYRLAASDGGVFDLGTSKPIGSLGGTHINAPIVGAAATPDGAGFWLAGADGGVYNYGTAGFFGSEGGIHLNSPVVGIAAAPDGKGYWLAAGDGGVFNHGSAGFFGSEGGVHLNKPVVGIAAAPDGKGYWLGATDGGVFNHGSAKFFGSEGGVHLNSPVVGIAAAPDGAGYFLAAGDGGVFNHGSAGFFGSEGGVKLAKPVVSIAVTPDGKGYWLAAGDGGVFNHGNAPFLGSEGGVKLAKPVVALAV
jgi:plastocyanin